MGYCPRWFCFDSCSLTENFYSRIHIAVCSEVIRQHQQCSNKMKKTREVKWQWQCRSSPIHDAGQVFVALHYYWCVCPQCNMMLLWWRCRGLEQKHISVIMCVVLGDRFIHTWARHKSLVIANVTNQYDQPWSEQMTLAMTIKAFS